MIFRPPLKVKGLYCNKKIKELNLKPSQFAVRLRLDCTNIQTVFLSLLKVFEGIGVWGKGAFFQKGTLSPQKLFTCKKLKKLLLFLSFYCVDDKLLNFHNRDNADSQRKGDCVFLKVNDSHAGVSRIGKVEEVV